jgi:hypothetical protein
MKHSIVVRSRSEAERQSLKAGLRSSHALLFYHSHMLLVNMHSERVPSRARATPLA